MKELFVLSHTWDSLLQDVAGVTDHTINPLSPETPADKARHRRVDAETREVKKKTFRLNRRNLKTCFAEMTSPS